MLTEINLVLTPEQAFYPDLFLQAASRKLEIPQSDIAGYRILHKSVDARQRNIKVNLSIQVYTGSTKEVTSIKPFHTNNVSDKQEIIIIGSGPAGLFAALYLIENGYKPVIFERGRNVHDRKKDIAQLNRNILLDPESNYCFGEGGAGTYSDGKLYTRSVKKGNIGRFLELLHLFGASEDILYESHPHIGSDKLPMIIEKIRNTIIECGGEIHFNSRLDDFIISGNRITKLVINTNQTVEAGHVILATGHSARDIYHLLSRHQIALENKGFAMGVRMEHPQQLINNIQYHKDPQSKFLPAATYSLSTQAEGRGVYSFCMCPGGFMVPAATAQGEIVVNGMSAAARNSLFANSGLVVEIRPEDVPSGYRQNILPGLAWQQHLEQMAFQQSDAGFKAPAQRLTDFLAGKISTDLPASSHFPGVVTSPLHEWLPREITYRLKQALKQFDIKMKGLITAEAILAGVESRTSSTIRIPRQPDSYCHTSMLNLYPCGEGAGYAGGIVSSALDGMNTAQKIIEHIRR